MTSIENRQSKIENSGADLFKSAPWWKPPGFSEAKLTAEETKVYNVVRFHLGRARAIQADEIAAMLDLTTRAVNAVVKTLTENHALAIGASVKKPFGYYLIDTADELENYCRQLHNRALSTLRRESILRRTHMLELLGQIRAELEAEGTPSTDTGGSRTAPTGGKGETPA